MLGQKLIRFLDLHKFLFGHFLEFGSKMLHLIRMVGLGRFAVCGMDLFDAGALFYFKDFPRCFIKGAGSRLLLGVLTAGAALMRG